MAYYAKKIIEKLRLPESELKMFTLNDVANSLPKNKPCCLVLLDDFAGTGESIQKFFTDKVVSKVTAKAISYVALTVASMQSAKDKLMQENGIVLYGDIYNKCFAKVGSVFGIGFRMKAMREFCFRYGEILLPNWKNEDLKPLGYLNSQAMIAFEHTTPNNTLPILWFEEKRSDNGKLWHSIFPRFASSRIERSKRFRRESYYWLYKLRQDFTSLNNPVNAPTKNVILLIHVMRLISKRHGEEYISQVLNISQGELEKIVSLGKEQSLITNIGKVSDEGKQFIEMIEKRNAIEKSRLSRMQMNINECTTLYIPQKFHGLA